MNNITKAQEGRLNKQLDKLYRWSDGQIMSVRDRIEKHHKGNIGIKKYVEEYSSRKVNLCYEKLTTPKVIYSWYTDDKYSSSQIPKIVADYYSKLYNIPIEV